MANPTLEVTLKFTKIDLQCILNNATDAMGMERVDYDKLSAKQLKLFHKAFNPKEFKIEIIEATEDAVANDWLFDLLQTFEEEE
jgi:hypothetical protein